MNLEERLDKIERLTLLAAKRFLTVPEMAMLLGYSEDRIYHLASSGEVPSYKWGKRLYFDKQEIEDLLLGNRQKSAADIEAEAQNYLVRQALSSPRKPAKTKRKTSSKSRPNV